MQFRDVVIVEGCRTAIGSMGGSLKPLHANELAGAVMNELIRRTGVDKGLVDEIILGQCRQSSDESNMARYAALRAGFPETTAAQTVMRQCASAMTAVQTGMLEIAAGSAEVVIAGGAESMSNGIFYLSNARWGVGTGTTELKDSLTEGQHNSQPQETYGKFAMGVTAENIAEKLGITREEQDALALMSHQRAAAATDEGRFKDEIVPVTVPQGRKKDPIVFDKDEFIRRDTSAEKLAKLKAVFRQGGTVTAGNSSGRNDGAAAVLMMTPEKAKELGLKPICRIIGMGVAGTDPRTMGLGPVYAVPKALAMAGLTADDMSVIELNEAFAAQALGCIKMLGWEDKMDIINPNGSGISLGHPIGCTGCRILVTLMYELRRRHAKYGLATLCIGGGMGQATVLEMIYDD
ncbi:MAG: thiolase family protein [Oscillospiraceae bacterium]|nr:thiolase family protein [Oscillospiraceae bacterium]MCC8155914.1 thiolase family protein [Oscillospiraceae bacterium]MCD8388803.1 thiolase family protein [Oscillospiraceae bacterium]